MGMALTERLTLRRQMAAAAGQKVYDILVSIDGSILALKLRRNFSTMATQYWAEGVWTRKWHHEQREAWMRQNSRSSDVVTGERTCRSSDV